jgi:hypothetical protein
MNNEENKDEDNAGGNDNVDNDVVEEEDRENITTD